MQFVQNCPSCRRTECFENISHSATIGKSRLACQGAAIAVAPLSRPSPNIWTRTYCLISHVPSCRAKKRCSFAELADERSGLGQRPPQPFRGQGERLFSGEKRKNSRTRLFLRTMMSHAIYRQYMSSYGFALPV